MSEKSIYTPDGSGNAAVRVTAAAPSGADAKSIYTTDGNGNAAMRITNPDGTIGGGGVVPIASDVTVGGILSDPTTPGKVNVDPDTGVAIVNGLVPTTLEASDEAARLASIAAGPGRWFYSLV